MKNDETPFLATANKINFVMSVTFCTFWLQHCYCFLKMGTQILLFDPLLDLLGFPQAMIYAEYKHFQHHGDPILRGYFSWLLIT